MANTKITGLSALNEKPATDDILAIVDVTGTDTTKKITVANLMKSDLTGNVTGSVAGTIPASASAAGTAGTIAWDASLDYIYVCTATNVWKRVAIATW